MKTKKYFLIGLLILAINSLIYSQGLPVYDNTNFISMTKSLIESAKQTAELLKTVEFLKEQKENIVLVNNVLHQLRAVRELNQNHQRVFQVMGNDLGEILNSPYIRAEEATQISRSFDAIMDTALEDLDFIEQILSSDFLKMTDAERTTVLKEKENNSKEMVAEITKKTERYQDIISFRRMQEMINNRATNY